MGSQKTAQDIVKPVAAPGFVRLRIGRGSARGMSNDRRCKIALVARLSPQG